jgi:ABC-type transport system substrate-binding protein
MFQPLWGTNPNTLQLEPVLAKEMPTEEYDEATQLLKYTFELRDDAKWDNGDPITINDLILV